MQTTRGTPSSSEFHSFLLRLLLYHYLFCFEFLLLRLSQYNICLVLFAIWSQSRSHFLCSFRSVSSLFTLFLSFLFCLTNSEFFFYCLLYLLLSFIISYTFFCLLLSSIPSFVRPRSNTPSFFCISYLALPLPSPPLPPVRSSSLTQCRCLQRSTLWRVLSLSKSPPLIISSDTHFLLFFFSFVLDRNLLHWKAKCPFVASHSIVGVLSQLRSNSEKAMDGLSFLLSFFCFLINYLDFPR
jgi:hypothetical protein